MFKATNMLTEEFFAIKQMFISKLQKRYRIRGINFMDQIKKEVAVMKKIRHHNLIQLEEVIMDEEKQILYFVMEFVNGGIL